MPWFETTISSGMTDGNRVICVYAHYTRNPVEVDDIRPDIELAPEEAEQIQREAEDYENNQKYIS